MPRALLTLKLCLCLVLVIPLVAVGQPIPQSGGRVQRYLRWFIFMPSKDRNQRWDWVWGQSLWAHCAHFGWLQLLDKLGAQQGEGGRLSEHGIPRRAEAPAGHLQAEGGRLPEPCIYERSTGPVGQVGPPPRWKEKKLNITNQTSFITYKDWTMDKYNTSV